MDESEAGLEGGVSGLEAFSSTPNVKFCVPERLQNVLRFQFLADPMGNKRAPFRVQLQLFTNLLSDPSFADLAIDLV